MSKSMLALFEDAKKPKRERRLQARITGDSLDVFGSLSEYARLGCLPRGADTINKAAVVDDIIRIQRIAILILL